MYASERWYRIRYYGDLNEIIARYRYFYLMLHTAYLNFKYCFI